MSNLHYFNRSWISSTDRVLSADICVYGGTSAGVVGAMIAAQRGRSVVILNPGRHLGGMSSGGLGWTDFGKKHVIGGASRRFYQDVGKHYGKTEEWQFEPRIAEAVFEKMVADALIPVHHGQYLDRALMEHNRIVAVRCLGGLTVRARCFIDATYEGDLLAQAGVSFTVGREPNSQYGETLNGIQIPHWHQFTHPVSPYRIEGDPASGLLPHIITDDLREHIGEGDQRVQAYNFRVCMTDDPQLKIPWNRPAGFDPDQYVLATRYFRADKDRYSEQLMNWKGEPSDVPRKFDRLPNKTPGGYHKTDTNNNGPVSSDFIGTNYDWPLASYEAREKIFQAHVTYQQGYYWHVANDPAIPQRYREAYSRWGLAKDEFLDTQHWPHQLYVREARRMISDYIITEADCYARRIAPDPVGMGSYTLDSHNCTRFIGDIGGVVSVLNEGDVEIPPTDPYPISYRCVIPRRGECENLFVPVCMSASHIAYGSARMEPVFMVLAQSCAIAADLAIAEGCCVQDVKYDALGPELLAAGQILRAPAKI